MRLFLRDFTGLMAFTLLFAAIANLCFEQPSLAVDLAVSKQPIAEKPFKQTISSFNALNEKGEPVSIVLDKNTVVIASTSWCHYCTVLYEALAKHPEVTTTKQVVFVHGNEWDDFARPRLTESLEMPLTLNLLSEEDMLAQVNAWVEKAKATVHPYYLYPQKVPALAGVQHVFIPDACTTCSPANWNAFPTAYNPRTKQFDKDPYKALGLTSVQN